MLLLRLIKKSLLHTFGLGKKVMLIVFVYALVISIFAFFFNKNRPDYDPNYTKNQARSAIYKTINDPKLNATKKGQLALMLHRLQVCIFSGEACSDNPEDGDKNAPQSVSGMMGKALAFPYLNPPASGVYWAYAGLENAGFIPTSYAAEGIGFGSLKPLMNIWKIFRDISYMILVLVLITIGFMIMFRMKINPQTVISVENTLPKIVTTLILITFSFAIAGFLIDMMYVLISIIISILSNNNKYYDTAAYQNIYLWATPGDIYQSLLPVKKSLTGISGKVGFGTIVYVGNAITSLLPAFINSVVQKAAWLTMGILLIKDIFSIASFVKETPNIFEGAGADLLGTGVVLGNIWSGIVMPIVAFIIVNGIVMFIALYGLGLIVGILVFLTIIMLFFRIFFMFVKAYLEILFLIILSPIILLLDAIPGKSMFAFWFKHLLADLLTFPIVIALLLIGNILLNSFAYPGDFWFPPFLTSIDPLGYSVIVGMGIMLLIPDIVKLAKSALGVKDLPVSVGLGTFFGGASAGIAGGTSILGQFSTMNLGLQALTGKSLRGLAGKEGPKPVQPPPASADPKHPATQQ